MSVTADRPVTFAEVPAIARWLWADVSTPG